MLCYNISFARRINYLKIIFFHSNFISIGAEITRDVATSSRNSQCRELMFVLNVLHICAFR